MNIIKTAAVTALAGLTLAGCTTVREAVVSTFAGTHDATLSGLQVVGMSRDSDGYATAQLTVADALNQICYDVNDMRNLGTFTSATINRGGYGRTGPVVLNLKMNAEANDVKACVNRAEWLENAFDRNPAGYYVQVNTTTGSIRGQFRR